MTFLGDSSVIHQPIRQAESGMRESLTEIITNFVRTSTSGCDDEGEAFAMLGLLGLMSYQKAFGSRKVAASDLAKLYDMAIKELQSDREKKAYERKKTAYLEEESVVLQSKAATRRGKNDFNRGEQIAVASGVDYAISSDTFLKMSQGGRVRVATKVFNEYKTGVKGLLITDIPVALKALGFTMDAKLETAINKYSSKISKQQQHHLIATAKVGEPAQPVVNLEMFLTVVKRFTNRHDSLSSSESVSGNKENCKDAANNDHQEQELFASYTDKDDIKNYYDMVKLRNKIRHSRVSDAFPHASDALIQVRPVDIAQDFIDSALGEEIVTADNIYDSYSKYNYFKNQLKADNKSYEFKPSTIKNFYGYEENSTKVYFEKPDEAADVAYLFDVDINSLRADAQQSLSLNAAVQATVERDISAMQARKTDAAADDAAETLHKQGWRAVNKGWVADFHDVIKDSIALRKKAEAEGGAIKAPLEAITMSNRRAQFSWKTEAIEMCAAPAPAEQAPVALPIVGEVQAVELAAAASAATPDSAQSVPLVAAAPKILVASPSTSPSSAEEKSHMSMSSKIKASSIPPKIDLGSSTKSATSLSPGASTLLAPPASSPVTSSAQESPKTPAKRESDSIVMDNIDIVASPMATVSFSDVEDSYMLDSSATAGQAEGARSDRAQRKKSTSSNSSSKDPFIKSKRRSDSGDSLDF